MNPEATITIPVYNSEKFIPKCLESALSQNTKRNYEVLVINDGSTDNTGKILDEFSRKNKGKLRVIHQKNAGVGITRNRLLEKSRGDVLITLDSDDYLSENALEKTMQSFYYNPKTDFVYSDHREVNENNNVLGEARKSEVNKYFNDIIFHCHFPGHMRAFRKDSIKGKKFNSELKYAEDYDFLLKTLVDKWPNHNTQHIPEILYNYRINGKGLTSTLGESTVPSKVVENNLRQGDIYGTKNVKVYEDNGSRNFPAEKYNLPRFAHEVNGERKYMKYEAEKSLLNFIKNGGN